MGETAVAHRSVVSSGNMLVFVVNLATFDLLFSQPDSRCE